MGAGVNRRKGLFRRNAATFVAGVLAVGAWLPAPRPVPAGSCHQDAPPVLANDTGGHDLVTMTRLSCTAQVAVYGDEAVAALPRARTDWVAPYVEDMWGYLKREYGSCAVPRELPPPIGPGCEAFGEPKPLTVLLSATGNGGTTALRFDGLSGYRNTLLIADRSWDVDDDTLRDVISHKACQVAESAGQGVHGSPAAEVWGDSGWALFCQYDMYVNTGRAGDAERLFTTWIDDVAWFRDWFFPLWLEGGGDAQVMHRFFRLLSRHFPKRPENDGRNLVYARPMTLAEYVHFTSDAAGKDLSTRAAQAFGAVFDRAQFGAARRDFAGVVYDGPACAAAPRCSR